MSSDDVTILAVDDLPQNVRLMDAVLSPLGFTVLSASSGEAALDLLAQQLPDIVLLDIVMPDLDGIEVMRQLRERRPVAVILLTAKGSTADKAKGLDLGADDYIAKPFHPDELAARVRAVLRRSSGAQQGAGVVKFDDVEIDLERRMVTRSGELVQLSRFIFERLFIHPQAELSILLVDEPAMEKLHIELMDEPGSTDVLSVPMDELTPGTPDKPTPQGMLGDIAICPQVARRQADEARERGQTGYDVVDELDLLTVHGVLHLLGYDHTEPAEHAEMFGLQARLLAEWQAVRSGLEVER